MAIKQFKPTSPGRRDSSGASFAEITRSKPERSLTVALSKRGSGRNNQGRITVRHRGGGSRRLYRIIDWKRDKAGVPAKVVSMRGASSRKSATPQTRFVMTESVKTTLRAIHLLCSAYRPRFTARSPAKVNASQRHASKTLLARSVGPNGLTAPTTSPSAPPGATPP